MALSVKKRFAIFERDSFTCQYCGKKPPAVILEVDHIVSRKDGGNDDPMNLITACFLCNRGKSSKSLDVRKIRKGFKEELRILKARKGQLDAYYNFLKLQKQVEDGEKNIFQSCWEQASNGKSHLTEKGLSQVKNLAETYPSEKIFEAIRIAWSKDYVQDERKIQYIAGILRNMKLQVEDPDAYQYFYGINRCLMLARKSYVYVNEKFLRKYLPDIAPEKFEDMVNLCTNWTQLKQAILLYCDAQD